MRFNWVSWGSIEVQEVQTRLISSKWVKISQNESKEIKTRQNESNKSKEVQKRFIWFKLSSLSSIEFHDDQLSFMMFNRGSQGSKWIYFIQHRMSHATKVAQKVTLLAKEPVCTHPSSSGGHLSSRSIVGNSIHQMANDPDLQSWVESLHFSHWNERCYEGTMMMAAIIFIWAHKEWLEGSKKPTD